MIERSRLEVENEQNISKDKFTSSFYKEKKRKNIADTTRYN